MVALCPQPAEQVVDGTGGVVVQNDLVARLTRRLRSSRRSTSRSSPSPPSLVSVPPSQSTSTTGRKRFRAGRCRLRFLTAESLGFGICEVS